MEARSRRPRLTFLHDASTWRQVARALAGDRRVYSVEPARSRFDDTRRQEHATLTTINFNDVAPLCVRLSEPVAERIGRFDIRLTELTLSRDGPVAFPFTVRFAPAVHNETLLVPHLLRDLVLIREATRRMLRATAQTAYEIVSGTGIFGAMSASNFEGFRDRIQRFEIFDFDYQIPSLGRPPVQTILEEPDSLAARELAGFIRMSRPEVWSTYKVEFLSSFFRRNLGNRVDELLLFHGARLVRHHPEEERLADVQLWFDDARLAITILLQKATALEFLHWVMRNDLSEIRQLLTIPRSDTLAQAESLLGVVEELSNRVVDPMIVERHVSHEFFRKVLVDAAAALDLPALSALCHERLQDVRATVGAIAAQVTSDAALRSARTTERLTKQMLWLSVLVTLLAIAQIIMAAKG